MTVPATEVRPSSPRPASASRESGGDLTATLSRLRDAHRRKGPPDEAQRLRWLAKLEKALLSNKDRIADVISADYGSRSRHESLVAEVFITASLIKYNRENLRHWMEPERRHVAMTFFPARAEVHQQPLGVVGIIAPWNYPVQLALAPLVCALAAGNRAMIKPSELTPKTGELLAEILGQAFEPDEVAVVTGGTDVGEAFSKLPIDHLVFTGSTRVGKIVMRAAAENLVPVTLELGGKSPVVVAPDFPTATAAERIISGKLFNSGQTCIAPDYVFLPAGTEDEFVAHAKQAVAAMYPKLVDNPDYTAVINAHHHKRLTGYVKDAEAKGAKIVRLNPASESFEGSNKFEPTIILGATDEMTVMQDQIFGPILPVHTYKDVSEALDYVNDHPRPLALYCFSHDDRQVTRVLTETTSGGVSINETMLHVAQDDLPFGGVGPSGMGAYHGREGFEAFSKKKPIFFQSRVNGTSLLRPPYGKAIDTLLGLLLGK